MVNASGSHSRRDPAKQAHQTDCPGTDITFSVEAAGSGLSYQWQKGGVPIPGATKAAYTIATISAAESAFFGRVAPIIRTKNRTDTDETKPRKAYDRMFWALRIACMLTRQKKAA